MAQAEYINKTSFIKFQKLVENKNKLFLKNNDQGGKYKKEKLEWGNPLKSTISFSVFIEDVVFFFGWLQD